MAPHSKKTNTKSSSPKKKTTTRKTPVKKRTRKKTSKNSNFKKNIFVLLGVFLMISLVAFGYFLGQNDKDSSIKQIKKTDTHGSLPPKVSQKLGIREEEAQKA